jgi:hypothetical protein
MTNWTFTCCECMEKQGTIRLNDRDIWPLGGYMCRECFDNEPIQ